MGKKLNWVFRTAVVVLIFLLVLSGMTMVMLPDKAQNIRGYYEEPANSLDLIFIGSSPLLRGVSPLDLWHEYGVVSYSRTSTLQPPFVAYNYLLEALENQSPKAVVLYLPKSFAEYNVDRDEPDVRKSVDYIPFSRYKLDMIRETVAKSEKQTVWSYLFPLMRYHDRWEELQTGDFDLSRKFGKGRHIYRGEEPLFGTVTVYEGFDYSQWDEKFPAKEVAAYSEEYLSLIVDVLNEKGIPLLLVDMPRIDPEYGRHSAYEALAEKYGIDFLDLSTPEAMESMGLDPSKDFYDKEHLSGFGSEAATKYLGQYLTDNYDLPDRRGEPDMERWDTDYEERRIKSQNALEKIDEIRRYPEEGEE